MCKEFKFFKKNLEKTTPQFSLELKTMSIFLAFLVSIQYYFSIIFKVFSSRQCPFTSFTQILNVNFNLQMRFVLWQKAKLFWHSSFYWHSIKKSRKIVIMIIKLVYDFLLVRFAGTFHIWLQKVVFFILLSDIAISLLDNNKLDSFLPT